MSELSVASAGAVQVLQTFLDASLRKDEPAMKACLTRKTLESGQMNNEGPEGVKYVLGEAQLEGENVVIPMKAVPIDAPADAPPAMEMACVMVKEDGAWKFDLLTTVERMMGGGLGAAMEQVASKMGEALAGGLSAAFGQESSAESVGEQNWAEASLEVGDDEFFPIPEMTPLPKTQAAITAAVGSTVLVLAAMPDLLRTVGSDDTATLFNWFEDALFVELAPTIAQVAARMPLAGRLRAVRIEAAKWSDDRGIALDGSDLVYRMYLNNNEGYYSDAGVAEILPGVLAGLPEQIDPRVAGHRLLANDEECPPLVLYRERVAPRWMRRISELLGHNVRLDANWDDPSDTSTMARQLSRWGLVRVYGAIALACQDESQRESLRNDLKTIRLIFGYNLGDRLANYRDGTLEVSIGWYHGEKCCFYEHDLVRVLGGEEIRYGAEAAPEAAEAADAEADQKEPQEEESPEAAPNAESQNAALFEGAVKSLREVESVWRGQLEMALGHEAGLVVDYGSLGGRFERVQPFVHQAVSGALQAISQLGFNPATQGRLRERVQQVIITAGADGQECAAELADGVLTVKAPLVEGEPPPTEQLAAAIEAELDGAADGQHKTTHASTYERAGRYMDQLEAAMRAGAMWPGDPPPEPLEVKGAFGCENLAFTQWLAWVLLPRVREIVAEKGEFPDSSSVAAYAVREFDGVPEAGDVLKVLTAFDEMVDGLNR
ncbi:MAG: YqcC family protein [Tepidisphaerales bacterium]